MFGTIWARNNPVLASTITEKDHWENVAIKTTGDVAFAVLLNYISG